MNIYFDCEFTGLCQNTTLISIGLISECGKYDFYAESDVYNKDLCDDWINKNVIDKLEFNDRTHFNKGTDNVRMKDNELGISARLNMWLVNIKEKEKIEKIQFVSDVCHYDMVLLINLLTTGQTVFRLPNWISPVCHDINQDIAVYYDISDADAFDLTREMIISTNKTELLQQRKHNSLYDAMVIREINQKISEKG